MFNFPSRVIRAMSSDPGVRSIGAHGGRAKWDPATNRVSCRAVSGYPAGVTGSLRMAAMVASKLHQTLCTHTPHRSERV
eukprot:3096417-Prymnesium_polylepis.1